MFFVFFHYKDSLAVCYLRNRSLLVNIPSVCSSSIASQNQIRSRKLPPPAGITILSVLNNGLRICTSECARLCWKWYLLVSACCLFLCFYGVLNPSTYPPTSLSNQSLRLLVILCRISDPSSSSVVEILFCVYYHYCFFNECQ